MNIDVPKIAWQALSTQLPEAVQKEVAQNKPSAVDHRKFLRNVNGLRDYLASDTSVAPMEYPAILDRLPAGPLTILDVGAGRGESSLFLASRGHQVHVVEPSVDYCLLIEEAATKFSLALSIMHGVAEDLDNVDGSGFDAVMFNSSLHHCDDPRKALANCFRLLKPNGQIFLSSEFHIHPWCTKARWSKNLALLKGGDAPHIGNEHGYYNWNYAQLLKAAGFVKMTVFLSVMSTNPLLRLERRLGEHSSRKERRCTPTGFLFLNAYYVATVYLVRAPLLFIHFIVPVQRFKAREAVLAIACL